MRPLLVLAVLAALGLPLPGVPSTSAWADTRVYDITTCKGGLWSYRVWGNEDRWMMPDENGIYWKTKIPKLGDQESAYFQVRGPVPAARYYSVSTYTVDRGSVDTLTDDEIVTSGGTFTVKIRDLNTGHQDPSPNVLRTANRSVGTEVMFRMYLPAGAQATWAPPRIEYVVTGTPAGLPQDGAAACKKFDSTYVAANQKKSPELLSWISAWKSQANTIAKQKRTPEPCYLPSERGEYRMALPLAATPPIPWTCNPPAFYVNYDKGYPNGDTRYLWANLDPFDSDGKLTVIRYRRPDMATQLRYSSICMHQGEHSAGWLLDCLADKDLRDDPGAPGWVTVVSSAGPAPSNIASANWLPYKTDAPLVLIRYLRPKPGFREAPHKWNPAAGPLSSHMGEYYPDYRYCTVAEFQQGGRCGL